MFLKPGLNRLTLVSMSILGNHWVFKLLRSNRTKERHINLLTHLLNQNQRLVYYSEELMIVLYFCLKGLLKNPVHQISSKLFKNCNLKLVNEENLKKHIQKYEI